MPEAIIVFMFGAVVGSFLNVCIYRLPRGESVVSPPSHCPGCGKPIPWYDNIPVASYLALGGRCRSCRERIRPRYVIVELVTAAVFVALFLFYGITAKFFTGAIFVSLLIVATFVDLERMEIPEQVSLGGLVVAFGISALFPQLMDTASRFKALGASAAGAAAGGGSIIVTRVLGKILFRKKLEQLSEAEAMGFGDVELMAMIGAFLGWKLALLTFFVAPFFGAAAGIILKIRHGRDLMPYGPYLSLGAVIVLFYGDEILRRLFYTF